MAYQTKQCLAGDNDNISSIRIVSVDNYMRYPIQGLDPCYSEFRAAEIKQVGHRS